MKNQKYIVLMGFSTDEIEEKVNSHMPTYVPQGGVAVADYESTLLYQAMVLKESPIKKKSSKEKSK